MTELQFEEHDFQRVQSDINLPKTIEEAIDGKIIKFHRELYQSLLHVWLDKEKSLQENKYLCMEAIRVESIYPSLYPFENIGDLTLVAFSNKKILQGNSFTMGNFEDRIEKLAFLSLIIHAKAFFIAFCEKFFEHMEENRVKPQTIGDGVRFFEHKGITVKY
jgi:hypothetical protein